MAIDWFTVIAQILNFAILVWLMKRFLYRPILDALDAREQRIAAELATAEAQSAAAQKERAEFHQKNNEFEQLRTKLVNQATEQATAERERLLEQAREAANELSAKRQESLRNEARNLNRMISQLTQQEVFAIAKKVLSDLATTSVEESIVEMFIRRLLELESKEKQTLAAAIAGSAEPAIVRTAFQLQDQQRDAIRDALTTALATKVSLQFETSETLVSGIELTTNGQKVSWSIAEYLTALENGVDTLLRGKIKPEARPQAESKVN